MLTDLRNKVFSRIPWTGRNFTVPFEIDDDIPCGFCGTHCKLAGKYLEKQNIPFNYFNHGLNGHRLSHIVIIADGVLQDFFFNKFYVNGSGRPLKFDELLKLVWNRQFELIHPVYGTGKKLVNGKEMSPQEFEQYILDTRFKDYDYEYWMRVIFGEINPLLLLLIPINKTKNDYLYLKDKNE